MKKTDDKLGMNSKISRRNFIHDCCIASLAMTVPGIALANSNTIKSSPSQDLDDYPPTRTGLRGSHPSRHNRFG